MTEQAPLEDFTTSWKEWPINNFILVMIGALCAMMLGIPSGCTIYESVGPSSFWTAALTPFAMAFVGGGLVWLWYKKTWPHTHSITFEAGGRCVITNHRGKKKEFCWPVFSELKQADYSTDGQIVFVQFIDNEGYEIDLPGYFRPNTALIIIKKVDEAWSKAKEQMAQAESKDGYQL